MSAAPPLRVTLRVARGARAQQAALDAWLAAAPPAPCAVIAEGAFSALAAPAALRVERLAAGCVCCLGLVPLQVTLTRLRRALRPRALLLLVADDAHLPRVRALLAGAGLALDQDSDRDPPEQPMNVPLQHVTANGIRIGCRIQRADAAAPWLVFAHSLAADHGMWAPQWAYLRGRCNLLGYDLRGHGASDAPAGDYPLLLLAGDLLALLDALGIAHCHLVGLSLGGMVAQQAALEAPARFASLVLADTSSRQPPEAAAIWRERVATVRARGMAPLVAPTLERWFTPAFREREAATVARIGAQIAATAVNGYVGCAHAVANVDLTDRLHAIRVPVQVLVGSEDRGTPPAMAQAIAQAIPGARLQVIADAAHLANLEQPAVFNAALEAFFGTWLAEAE